MKQLELFRRLAAPEHDLRGAEALWAEISRRPDFVDSRDCGLVDAVQSGWYQGDTNELFVGFPISAEDSVLDVGCGAGGATLFCANRGASVTYTDVEPNKIAVLNDKVKLTPARQARGFVSDSFPLPVATGSMSRIVSTEVLEHVVDPPEFLRELARVGQPGALYLLSVPAPLGEHLQKDIAPAYYFEKPNHIHIFEREEFASLVQDAGLEILRHESFGFFWTFWVFLYWSLSKSVHADFSEEAHDIVQPPYPPLLNDWASLWHQMLQIPETAAMRKSLDGLLPKSQVIVARKPESSET
jgi:SAM-dependent methyltransferase